MVAAADLRAHAYFMRIRQPVGRRGSLKWIQRAVNERWPALERPITAALQAGSKLRWLSPLADDEYAEYRDIAFLQRIGHPGLEAELRAFWPARGPQWDALACGSNGDVILVEAKAHVGEMCSPPTAAGPVSRARIEAAFADLAGRLGARPIRASWADHFYQLANRIAHLDFLRRHGVEAWLVLVSFVDDTDMGGPRSDEAWDAAYQVAFNVMGLNRSHALARFIIHVNPSVAVAEGVDFGANS